VSAMGQGDAQPQSEGQAESQGPDLSQITGQLETLGTGLEEMRQFMQAQQQPAEPQQEEQGADEVDLSWLDQVSLEDPSVAQAAQAKLNEQLSGIVDQRTQAAVQPLMQQLTSLQHDIQARDLAAEYPELATEEMAQKVAGRGGLAEQMAGQLGNPELASQPSFWRLVYMAHKAAETASQDGSENPGAGHLEGGSGPGPAPQSEEDIVKGIMGAGGVGSKVLNFRMGS
jgi:DNA-binding transcriptional MerR regulator